MSAFPITLSRSGAHRGFGERGFARRFARCVRSGEPVQSTRPCRDAMRPSRSQAHKRHDDLPGSRDRWDALVIGGGPAGAAAGFWLAQAGHRVLVVEKKQFPREKTCGDGLTPRAVRQLHDIGLAEPLSQYLRFDGLRSIAHGVTLELAWPEHPDFPPYGYVVRRRDLDKLVADRAAAGRRGGVVGCRSGRAGRRRWHGHGRGHPTRRREPGRCRPATSWWPTAPTRASGARSARPATAPTRWAWRCGATSPARSTTSRGSRAISTCTTATATTCRATGGSSPWATAR